MRIGCSSSIHRIFWKGQGNAQGNRDKSEESVKTRSLGRQVRQVAARKKQEDQKQT